MSHFTVDDMGTLPQATSEQERTPGETPKDFVHRRCTYTYVENEGTDEHMGDDDFLCERNDEIDNATFEAIRAFAQPYAELDWSMNLIGAVNDFIESLLLEHNLPVCHPWHGEDGTICHKTIDRCKYCRKQSVPLLKE